MRSRWTDVRGQRGHPIGGSSNAASLADQVRGGRARPQTINQRIQVATREQGQGGLLVNVGCGPFPTPGYVNFDNSPSLLLGRVPGLVPFLKRVGVLASSQAQMADVANQTDVRWADVRKRIPLPDSSARVVYSCHMLEHLSRDEARSFLREAKRVLRPGGRLRIAVPNLRYFVDRYLESGDADSFVDGLLLSPPSTSSLLARTRFLLVGNRHHQHMYDARSLKQLLSAAGFADAIEVDPGTTTIPEPGALDLTERAGQSIYVEALRP